MKKIIFVFLFLCFLSGNTLAQSVKPITKGNYLLGGGFNSYYYAFTDYRLYGIGIAPNVGYFIVDNVAVGVSPFASYSNNNSGGDFTNEYWGFGLGVFGKYYANNGFVADLRFSAGYNNNENTSFSITPRIGYAYFINNKVSIEGLVGPTIEFGDYEYWEIPFTIGFQIFL